MDSELPLLSVSGLGLGMFGPRDEFSVHPNICAYILNVVKISFHDCQEEAEGIMDMQVIKS